MSRLCGGEEEFTSQIPIWEQERDRFLFPCVFKLERGFLDG